LRLPDEIARSIYRSRSAPGASRARSWRPKAAWRRPARSSTASRVFGPIFGEYERRGSETGPLGFPIFDQLIDGIPTRFFQNFEHGQIRMEDGDILVLDDTPDTGATMIGEDETPF